MSLTPGQTHYVHIYQTSLHTHTHTRIYVCTCTQAHCTHTLYSPLREEEEEGEGEEEESWQFDPLDPGGQTHVPELQVPPLRIQDEEHPKGTQGRKTVQSHEITTQA